MRGGRTGGRGSNPSCRRSQAALQGQFGALRAGLSWRCVGADGRSESCVWRQVGGTAPCTWRRWRGVAQAACPSESGVAAQAAPACGTGSSGGGTGRSGSSACGSFGRPWGARTRAMRGWLCQGCEKMGTLIQEEKQGTLDPKVLEDTKHFSDELDEPEVARIRTFPCSPPLSGLLCGGWWCGPGVPSRRAVSVGGVRWAVCGRQSVTVAVGRRGGGGGWGGGSDSDSGMPPRDSNPSCPSGAGGPRPARWEMASRGCRQPGYPSAWCGE